MVQGAGLFLAPNTSSIVLEDFRKPRSVPKPARSSATRGPTSVRSASTKLVPVVEVNRVKPRLEPFEVRPSSSHLAQSPSLAVLARSGTSLAPGNETPGSLPPGPTRVPTNSRGELRQSAERPT
eukprot:1527114-Amphidinium_carterae.1